MGGVLSFEDTSGCNAENHTETLVWKSAFTRVGSFSFLSSGASSYYKSLLKNNGDVVLFKDAPAGKLSPHCGKDIYWRVIKIFDRPWVFGDHLLSTEPFKT